MQTSSVNQSNICSQTNKTSLLSKSRSSSFGSVFSNMTKITDETKSTNDNKTISNGMEELLSFLSINHLTEIEGAGAFIEDWMVNGAEVNSHPFMDKLFKDEEISSLNELLGSFFIGLNLDTEKLPSLGEGSFFEVSLKALRGITEMLNGPEGYSQLKDNLPLIKMAKLQTMLANFMDLSNADINTNNAVKSFLNEIASKLEKQLSYQNTSSYVKQLDSTLEETKQTFTSQINTLKEHPKLNSKETLLSAFQRNIKQETADMLGLPKSLSLATSDQPLGQGFTLSMSKVEQFVLTVGKSDTSVNQEQFIKSFESIIAKSILQNGKGLQKILIRLNPEHLGSLRIELIQKDSMMVAKILASSGKAKELLDSHLSGLKQAFTNQNLSVERVEVSQSFNPFTQEKSLTREHGQNQHQPRHQEDTNQEQDDNEVDFLSSFEEALLSVEG
ncbi:flagellar hook-length control protein FliK [Peribacillus alkalitolerans]|uniref:flagellar hook-length control protein FliK n=1 Tax=Peribacillus alkalitolerans TaxID=1550385 RepID=UPI0013D18404|nr:flagellar hook-length control protein FliK [Peribacillus alkalitolerans]